jgi:nitrogen-specific signal transduction histidine kinase
MLFGIIDQQDEMKEILDNLQESIITFENDQVDFVNDGFDKLFEETFKGNLKSKISDLKKEKLTSFLE